LHDLSIFPVLFGGGKKKAIFLTAPFQKEKNKTTKTKGIWNGNRTDVFGIWIFYFYKQAMIFISFWKLFLVYYEFYDTYIIPGNEYQWSFFFFLEKYTRTCNCALFPPARLPVCTPLHLHTTFDGPRAAW
jgi:hypothetical protein